MKGLQDETKAPMHFFRINSCSYELNDDWL